MEEQFIIRGYETVKNLHELASQIACNKFLLVCDSAFEFLNLGDTLQQMPHPYVVFNEFSPNPDYEDVCKGVRRFHEEKCDAIIAIGGGSAIDVAKCIKLFSSMQPDKNYLTQEFITANVPFVAIPTTAGTGSEATHFAVIYYEGQKKSVAHQSLIPDYVILDHSLLKTLPLYQKKCTMLDALCHGIESWWSIHSTEESQAFSHEAVLKIMEYKDEYLRGGDVNAAEQIMLAAHLAGKAINLTKTTAAHAMSYKITSLYHIPHGHAAAICLPKLWQYMTHHMNLCSDERGEKYVERVFLNIAHALGENSVDKAIEKLENMLDSMGIESPSCDNGEIQLLIASVNEERLRNNPVMIRQNDFQKLYKSILKSE